MEAPLDLVLQELVPAIRKSEAALLAAAPLVDDLVIVHQVTEMLPAALQTQVLCVSKN